MANKNSDLNIFKDIEYAFNNGKNFEIDIDIFQDPVVIFSDHHRGYKKKKDDFEPCMQTYLNALNYYYNNNYRLILLGDVEDFLENDKVNKDTYNIEFESFPEIHNKYIDIYELEYKFFDKNKKAGTKPFYLRCFGNHDYKFVYPEHVKKHLDKTAGYTGIEVYEGIKMNVFDRDIKKTQLYLTHGHQGLYKRDISTLYEFLTYFFANHIQTIPTNRSIISHPKLRSVSRRETHEGYLTWAKIKQMAVIYGHTHEPVFDSIKLYDNKIIDVKDQNNDPITSHNAFNTGGFFGDGVISGIEITNGEIKLIKWDPQSIDPIPLNREIIDNLIINL